MAEGYLRKYSKNNLDLYSAGISPDKINQNTIDTMFLDGIDISNHTSNNVLEYLDYKFDFVITLCNNAKLNCPSFAYNPKIIHRNFLDPYNSQGNDIQIKSVYMNVREEIKLFCQEFISSNFKDLYINEF